MMEPPGDRPVRTTQSGAWLERPSPRRCSIRRGSQALDNHSRASLLEASEAASPSESTPTSQTCGGLVRDRRGQFATCPVGAVPGQAWPWGSRAGGLAARGAVRSWRSSGARAVAGAARAVDQNRLPLGAALGARDTGRAMSQENVEDFIRRAYARFNQAEREPPDEENLASLDFWHPDSVYVNNAPTIPTPAFTRALRR